MPTPWRLQRYPSAQAWGCRSPCLCWGRIPVCARRLWHNNGYERCVSPTSQDPQKLKETKKLAQAKLTKEHRRDPCHTLRNPLGGPRVH